MVAAPRLASALCYMLNYDELALMANIPHLADSWKRYAVRRLENRKVEDWTNRLEGDKS